MLGVEDGPRLDHVERHVRARLRGQVAAQREQTAKRQPRCRERQAERDHRAGGGCHATVGARRSQAREEPGASSVAVLVSTAVFVGVHAQFTWLPIAVMGIILAVLYAKTRTLWPGIVFHGLHNLFTLYYPVFDK